MPHPNVTAIFPSFEDPDHFDRTLTGRYVCKLCPEVDGSQRTFNTEKAALAHERSTDHTLYAELEKNNPWNAEPGADSAGWGSEAAKAHQQMMSPEEVKDKEYRKRVSELPGTIEKWRAGFLEFARDGEMLPVDRPATSKRKSRRGKAAKNADTPNESKVTQIPENAPSGVQQSSITTSSIDGRDASTQIAPGSHTRDNSTYTAPSKPAADPAPVQMRRKPCHLFLCPIFFHSFPPQQPTQRKSPHPLLLNSPPNFANGWRGW